MEKKLIAFDAKNCQAFVRAEEIAAMATPAEEARKLLVSGKGEGSDFTGWIDLPVNYDKKEFERIQKAAAKIREDSEALIVIGIGGSYLGARATIEALCGSFYNQKSAKARKGPEIYFVGHQLSPVYLAELVDLVKGRPFSINVISKSGTTTEPAVAFRIFKKLLIDQVGEKEAAKRIYATTDKKRGALKTEAKDMGYPSFVVPDDVGGRYSVLTAVGLLPIAVAGIDLTELMRGAQDMRQVALKKKFADNPVLQYAAIRNILNRKGKGIEILCNYEPSLHMVSEWWKQLYGESEGKDQKGIFPASVDLTTDLHSMGQFIQDGSRNLFETVIAVQRYGRHVKVEKDKKNLDGLNYLAGKDLAYINKCAMEGTTMAHIEGGVPNLRITLPQLSPYYLGQLFYFFELACGVSGYMLGVNPFNQPGVEFYKRNMFKLLGKPGYR